MSRGEAKRIGSLMELAEMLPRLMDFTPVPDDVLLMVVGDSSRLAFAVRIDYEDIVNPEPGLIQYLGRVVKREAGGSPLIHGLVVTRPGQEDFLTPEWHLDRFMRLIAEDIQCNMRAWQGAMIDPEFTMVKSTVAGSYWEDFDPHMWRVLGSRNALVNQHAPFTEGLLIDEQLAEAAAKSVQDLGDGQAQTLLNEAVKHLVLVEQLQSRLDLRTVVEDPNEGPNHRVDELKQAVSIVNALLPLGSTTLGSRLFVRDGIMALALTDHSPHNRVGLVSAIQTCARMAPHDQIINSTAAFVTASTCSNSVEPEFYLARSTDQMLTQLVLAAANKGLSLNVIRQGVVEFAKENVKNAGVVLPDLVEVREQVAAGLRSSHTQHHTAVRPVVVAPVVGSVNPTLSFGG